MEFVRPDSWREALEAKAAHSGAVPIFGATDVMVEMKGTLGSSVEPVVGGVRVNPRKLLSVRCSMRE